jgi:hypothetical protein
VTWWLFPPFGASHHLPHAATTVQNAGWFT